MSELCSPLASSSRLSLPAALLCLLLGGLPVSPTMARPAVDRNKPKTFKPQPLKPAATHKHSDHKVLLTPPFTKSTGSNRSAKSFKPRPTGYVSPKPKPTTTYHPH